MFLFLIIQLLIIMKKNFGVRLFFIAVFSCALLIEGIAEYMVHRNYRQFFYNFLICFVYTVFQFYTLLLYKVRKEIIRFTKMTFYVKFIPNLLIFILSADWIFRFCNFLYCPMCEDINDSTDFTKIIFCKTCQPTDYYIPIRDDNRFFIGLQLWLCILRMILFTAADCQDHLKYTRKIGKLYYKYTNTQ